MTRHEVLFPLHQPHVKPAVGMDVLRDWAAFGALVATFASVLGLFAVSPTMLEARGIAYLSSGGGILAKFHPSTIGALVALALRCLGSRRPARTAWRLLAGDAGIVLMLGAVAIAGVFATFIDKTPVTPIVDTFVLPILTFVLLRDLDPKVLRWLAVAVALLLVANAVVALAEFLTGWRLIPFEVPDDVTADPTRADATFSWRAELSLDWRAVALLGHPLVNGLIVGAFLLCLLAPASAWMPAALRLPLIALEATSMFAFGARTALVLTAAFGTTVVVRQLVDAVVGGVRFTPRQIAATLLCAGLCVAGLTLAAQSGFLDRTLQRFTEDAGSATTRLTMFALFEPISWSDLVLRPDKDLVATLQRIYGLEFGIESSWLGLALTYGLIVTGIVVIGLIAFSASVLRRSSSGGGLVLALYFILASVSATMSGKTTTFAMTVALLMLFLRRVPTGRRARPDELV